MTKQQIKSFKDKIQNIHDFATDVLDTIEAHKLFAKNKHKRVESVFNEESVNYFLMKVQQMCDDCSSAQYQIESIMKLAKF